MNSTDIAAFKYLRTALICSPVLQPPKLNIPFILKYDCSQLYIGAILFQENELGQDHPVASFAKKLLQRETKYSTVERVFLRVSLALKNVERYIFGIPVTIITDRNCLKWLLTKSPYNSRPMRWALCLQRYNIIDI